MTEAVNENYCWVAIRTLPSVLRERCFGDPKVFLFSPTHLRKAVVLDQEGLFGENYCFYTPLPLAHFFFPECFAFPVCCCGRKHMTQHVLIKSIACVYDFIRFAFLVKDL